MAIERLWKCNLFLHLHLMYKVFYSRLYYKYYVEFYKIYIILDFRIYNHNV